MSANRRMHTALDIVANGDHSDKALEELFVSCQDWKRQNPTIVKMARSPKSSWGNAPPLLPTTTILSALRHEDWADLERQSARWEWENPAWLADAEQSAADLADELETQQDAIGE